MLQLLSLRLSPTKLVLLLLLASLFAPLPGLAKTVAPETAIASSPPASTTSTSASFAFTSSIRPSTFSCSLDSAAYSKCISPTTYSALSVGTHTFAVRATAANLTDPTPATYTWTILARNTPEGQGYSDSNTPQANSQAIQAAVDYAQANNLRLDLGARTYTYAGNVVVPSGVELIGRSSDPTTGTVLKNVASTPGIVIANGSTTLGGYRFQHLAIQGGSAGFLAGPDGPTFAVFSDLWISVPNGEGWQFTGGAEQVLLENITCVNTSTCVHGYLNESRESRWDKSTFRNFSASYVANVIDIETNLENDLRFENVTMSHVSVRGVELTSDGGTLAGEMRSILVIGGWSTDVAGAAWKIKPAKWPGNTPFAGSPTYAGWLTFKGGSWGKLDLTAANNPVLLDHTTYTALIDPNHVATAYEGPTAADPTAPGPLPVQTVDPNATPEAYGYSDSASGSSNAAAFSSAFGYAASHGVPVILKRRRYTYAGPISVPSGVTVFGGNGFGDTSQATELVNTAATAHFNISGSNIRFEDVLLLQGSTGFRLASPAANLTFAHLSLRVWDGVGWDVSSAVSGLHIADISCSGMLVCFRALAASSLATSDFTDIWALNDSQVLRLEGSQSNLTFAGMRMHNTCRLNPTCAGSDAYFSGPITNMSVIGGFAETGYDNYTWELHPSPGSSIVFEGGHWGGSLNTTVAASIYVTGSGSSVRLLNVNSPYKPVYDPDYLTTVFPVGSIAVTR
jgi:hypothetical protein